MASSKKKIELVVLYLALICFAVLGKLSMGSLSDGYKKRNRTHLENVLFGNDIQRAMKTHFPTRTEMEPFVDGRCCL